jgi:putative FmdB family regulatory protein
MPIFEYKCSNCGKTFETLELPGQENNVKCTNCGSDDLKKLISAPFLTRSGAAAVLPERRIARPAPVAGSSLNNELLPDPEWG